MVAVAPVAATAWLTVSKMGRPLASFCPPLPGVTPPTIFVPYSRHPLVWNAPAAPVMPWVMTFVSGLTRMLIGPEGYGGGGRRARAFAYGRPAAGGGPVGYNAG